MTEELKCELVGSALVVTIHGINAKCEISDPTLFTLAELFRAPPAGVAVMVLRGAGEHFCGGRAPSLPAPMPTDGNVKEHLQSGLITSILSLYDAMRNCEVPVAAFVAGVASGLGCALVGACDYV